MTHVPASSRGIPASGGDFTGQTTFRVVPVGTGEEIIVVWNDQYEGGPIDPADQAFSVTGDGSVYFRSGNGTIGLFVVDEAGTAFLDYRSGQGLRLYVAGAAVHALLSASLGFFGAAPAAQQAHIADPAGGAIQDAESRAAIASLLDKLEAYGLLAAI